MTVALGIYPLPFLNLVNESIGLLQGLLLGH
jgi:hypothetical protein